MLRKIFKKKDKDKNGNTNASAASSKSSKKSDSKAATNRAAHPTPPLPPTVPVPIPSPATAAANALRMDDPAEKAMGQSWASSLSGASTPGSTDDEGSHGGQHHRCTSLPVIPPVTTDHHKVSSNGSTSSLKKASLRRTSSLSASNPKTLTHSTSAIGLDEMMEDRREFGTLGQNVVHLEVPFGKPIEEVYDGVHNGPVLGSGISGMVRLATHKATGIKYAVKVLDLGLVESPEGLEQLREEIYIMCQLDHPNIVRLEEVYESHSEIYLVQELCLGGELFDRLDEQPDYHYTEAECARLVKQMLSAVRYLHLKGIIHRGTFAGWKQSSWLAIDALLVLTFSLDCHRFKAGKLSL